MSGYTPPRPDAPGGGRTAPDSWAYEGKRYSIGSAPGYWGIWVKGVTGVPPLETFPQDQAGWGRAWARLKELEASSQDVPFWRRRGVGWVVLNLGVGLVFWFGLVFAMYALIAASGHVVSGEVPESPAIDGATFLLLVAAECGWLLHGYLRASTNARRIVLAGVYAGSVLAGVIIAAPSFPRS